MCAYYYFCFDYFSGQKEKRGKKLLESVWDFHFWLLNGDLVQIDRNVYDLYIT